MRPGGLKRSQQDVFFPPLSRGLDDASQLKLGLFPELAVHQTGALRKDFCCQLASIVGKIRAALLRFLLLFPPLFHIYGLHTELTDAAGEASSRDALAVIMSGGKVAAVAVETAPPGRRRSLYSQSVRRAAPERMAGSSTQMSREDSWPPCQVT